MVETTEETSDGVISTPETWLIARDEITFTKMLTRRVLAEKGPVYGTF